MIENYITVQDLGRTTQESDCCPSFWLWNFNSGHVGGMSAIADVVSSWLNIHIKVNVYTVIIFISNCTLLINKHSGKFKGEKNPPT